MKQQLSVLPFLAISATSGAYSDDFTLAAPIEAVTVYQTGGALVQREARLDLPAGSHRVTVSGLTASLDAGFGVNAGADGLSITNVHNTTSYLPAPRSVSQMALEKQLSQARDALAQTENAIGSADMRLAYLRGLGDNGTAGKDWQSALDFIGDKTKALMAEKHTLVGKRREQAALVTALEQEIAATSGRSDRTYNAVINVEVPKAGNYTFDISYLVHSASWGITTDANLNTEATQAEINLTADVRQSSGEAWDNVNLSLSTSRPSWNIAAPEMNPEFLRVYDRDEMRRPIDAAAEYAPAPRAMADQKAERLQSSQMVSQTATTYDMSFNLNNSASVPSTGTPQQYLMQTVSLDADIITRITPRYDSQNAYVYADVIIDGLPHLSSVSAKLSRDGHYAGRGRWPNLLQGEKTELPFGTDSGIKVETITSPSRDGDTGFFGKKNVEEERLVYRVTNNRDKKAVVEVTDRLPVPAHEDVKVELLKGATQATTKDVDSKAGVITWKKELAPGEVWEIRHEYRITYPSDMALQRSRS
ncbi:mucoidy inhibitor MuiA family protein [Kordiimonas sp.]|uniref:mucoidy inhibitor MuiA family protein n=1 Tax=Kordiimonas sp. TaxID=1970157 RepID=UPI003A8E4133